MSYIIEQKSINKYGLKPGIVNPSVLYDWMTDSDRNSTELFFPEGTWILPVNFQKDFGDSNITISGVSGKTIITSYDGTPGTNFAVPEKIDITKPKPSRDGVYVIDIGGLPYNASSSSIDHIHYDFRNISWNPDSVTYIQVSNGIVSTISFSQVKSLGYVTELRVGDNVDPGADGLYVVSQHITISYGGGHTHLNLRYLNAVSGATTNFNTGGQDVLYVQGTVLKRENGIWSRHYTGAGFSSRGNIIIKDIIFDNCQFNIVSPFDISGSRKITSSDKLEISGCVFKNCGKVFGSSGYANSQAAENFWPTILVYSNDGRFRFRNFIIENCEFSYIHSAIMWGFPPSESTVIRNNNIHDCYTILTCFYMFVTYYGGSTFFKNRISQTVTENSFINVRPLNSGANWNTTIMRTSGSATVSDNKFINVTQQCAYLHGGNATFSGNTIYRWIDMGTDPYSIVPCILTKTETNTVNLISNNTVVAPLGSFVGLEGPSNITLLNNTFIGCTRNRYILSTTTQLERDRIYYVKNISKFESLANTDPYNQAYVTLNPADQNYVFYNIKKKIWDKLPQSLPSGFVFSKGEEANNDQEYIKISGNKIECEGITRIVSDNQLTFKYVSVSNNEISDCTYLHYGNNSTVQDYICSNNLFRNSSILISSGLSLTNQISNLYFEDNKIGKSKDSTIDLWADENLIFKGNYMTIDSFWSPSSVNSTDYSGGIAAYDYYVFLRGASSSKILCEGNKFTSEHSKYGCLSIVSPYIADVRNNIFSTVVPSQQTSSAYRRICLNINSSSLINSLSFIGNTMYVESGKTNNIIEFDSSTSTISNLTIDSNAVSSNPSSISNNVLASNKTVNTLLLGTNLYNSSTNTIGSIGTTINLK